MTSVHVWCERKLKQQRGGVQTVAELLRLPRFRSASAEPPAAGRVEVHACMRTDNLATVRIRA